MPRNMIIHLVGTSGSGKSTALKDMYEMSNLKTFIINPEDNLKEATYLRDMKTILVGTYANDCGGCDTITGHGGLSRANEIVKKFVSDEDYDGMTILLEGLLMGSYVNILRLYEIANDNNSNYVVVHCHPPLEMCFDRVSQRNGGKVLKQNKTLEGRHKSLRNNDERVVAAGVPLILWDNSEIDREDMLPELMNIVEEYMNMISRKDEYEQSIHF